jgi:hypothetical protein
MAFAFTSRCSTCRVAWLGGLLSDAKGDKTGKGKLAVTDVDVGWAMMVVIDAGWMDAQKGRVGMSMITIIIIIILWWNGWFGGVVVLLWLLLILVYDDEMDGLEEW